MLAPASIQSAHFVAAKTPDSTRLQPSPELLQSAPLGNLCPTYGHYGYVGRRHHAGAIWLYKHAVRDDRSTESEMDARALA